MFDKTWFKFLVWSMASFFFFINACVLIATCGPMPTEGQIHLWMAGMMSAMHQSMMAFSMQLEEGSSLAQIMVQSSRLVLPLVIVGILGGMLFKVGKQNGKETK